MSSAKPLSFVLVIERAILFNHNTGGGNYFHLVARTIFNDLDKKLTKEVNDNGFTIELHPGAFLKRYNIITLKFNNPSARLTKELHKIIPELEVTS